MVGAQRVDLGLTLVRFLSLLAVLIFSAGGGGLTASASTEKVLYSFTGGDDGADPESSLLIDASGNLYGTTYDGGVNGDGVLFKVSRRGRETVLHSFGFGDGKFPAAGLIGDQNGTLYGTTSSGGTYDAGTVYKFAPDGSETILHSFGMGSDGADPVADLGMDADNNLYGTTYSGGADNDQGGTVFKITSAGVETILHSFTFGNDGGRPEAGVIVDKKGNLYGTTFTGANGFGTAFKLTKDGSFKILHVFSGADDGGGSSGTLFLRKGQLFGTTVTGGAFNFGTVFELRKHTETVLYSFADSGPAAGLIMDRAGNLFGTTPNGGPDMAGTVFKIAPDGTETLLYTFTGGVDGAAPLARLTMDKHGNLYGTTQGGGFYGWGTVFKIGQ
jgi:uncharacterized repeat protein (TIGR03803 family)